MSSLTILFLLLVIGAFIVFRWLSRTVVTRPNQNSSDRLLRIRKASFLFQAFTCIGLVLSVYWALAFWFGWPFFSQNVPRFPASQGHIYSSPEEMPDYILALSFAKMGLNWAAAATLFVLFRLYGRGILFSPKNVLLIRLQGYYIILGYIVDYQIQSSLHDMDLSSTPIFVGVLIIFFAWIMDEGRKIQEEQALTV
jgi:hypothetical protein